MLNQGWYEIFLLVWCISLVSFSSFTFSSSTHIVRIMLQNEIIFHENRNHLFLVMTSLIGLNEINLFIHDIDYQTRNIIWNQNLTVNEIKVNRQMTSKTSGFDCYKKRRTFQYWKWFHCRLKLPKIDNQTITIKSDVRGPKMTRSGREPAVAGDRGDSILWGQDFSHGLTVTATVTKQDCFLRYRYRS